MGDAWFQKKDQPQGDNQYGIWEVQRLDGKGGVPLNADGTLDRKSLSKMEITADVRKKIEKVGTDTALRQISITYDDNAGDKDGRTLPNMEELRLMASRWTRMFRNRLVSNIGELRAMDPGVEVALNEDLANCDAYEAALPTQGEPTKTQERLAQQGRLDPRTMGVSMSQRMQRCKMLRQVSPTRLTPRLSATSKQGIPIVNRSINGEAA